MILELEQRPAEERDSSHDEDREDSSAMAREQFNELTKPLMCHLLEHARSILHSEDLAWDAVQEALLGLWQKAERGDAVLSFAGPWLCRAVILRSLQIARQNGRRSRHERLAAACRTDIAACHLANGDDDSDELRRVLDLAMAALPCEFRSVLDLRILQGLDYAATAHHLGIPIGTVRSRLNRARSLLHQILETATCDTMAKKRHTRNRISHPERQSFVSEYCQTGCINCSSCSDREEGSL